MTKSTEKYRRVPSTVLGTLLRWFDQSSAWLAGDHVLLARRALWIERYNRFYFADIQAVTICRTQTGLVWNVLLGTGAGLLTFGGILSGFPPAVLVWLAIFTLPLIMNILLGPTCSCHVYTAVNTHKLPCFNRLPKAIIFLQTIKPLIAAVQEEVSDEEIAERAPLIPPIRWIAPGAPTPRPKRHYAGQVHLILLVLLFFGAIVSGLQLLSDAELLTWLTVILLIAQLGMSIAAAARQSGTDISSGLRAVTWCAFAHVLVMFVLFLILSVVASREAFERSIEFDLSTEGGDDVSTTSAASMMHYMMNLLSMLFSMILCFTGRYLLSAFRDDYRLRRMAARARIRTLDKQET